MRSFISLPLLIFTLLSLFPTLCTAQIRFINPDNHSLVTTAPILGAGSSITWYLYSSFEQEASTVLTETTHTDSCYFHLILAATTSCTISAKLVLNPDTDNITVALASFLVNSATFTSYEQTTRNMVTDLPSGSVLKLILTTNVPSYNGNRAAVLFRDDLSNYVNMKTDLPVSSESSSFPWTMFLPALMHGKEGTNQNTFAYPGHWNGTFTGTDTGTWSVTIDGNGTISGTGYSNDLRSTFILTGAVTEKVFEAEAYTTGGASTGADFRGTVIAPGTVTGSWTNSNYTNEFGTFSGKLE